MFLVTSCVAPTLVTQGQEAGKVGLSRAEERQPLWPARATVPLSPEAKIMLVPCRPSLRYSKHCLSSYLRG